MRLDLDDGGYLYFEVHGVRGPWLILLNGAMSSTAAWMPLAPALAQRHRLILVDFRDQGQSSTRAGAYDVGANAQDVLALLDHLRAERVSMMGISYGGLVAMAFARDHAERLSHVILAAVTARPSAHLLATGEAWEALAGRGDARPFLSACNPLVYSRQFYERAGSWLAQRTELAATLITPAWLRAFIRISQSARVFDFTDDLPRITVPTLLVCGTEDALMCPEDVFAMAAHIPVCQTLAIPGAGHGLFVEKPSELITAVLGFTTRWLAPSP